MHIKNLKSQLIKVNEFNNIIDYTNNIVTSNFISKLYQSTNQK